MSTDKWMDKGNVIFSYYSALKKAILSYAITWMNIKDIIPSEISHKKINTTWFYLYEVYRAVKYTEKESEMVAARGWEGEMGVTI